MSDWKTKAANKKAERDSHFKKEWMIPEDKLPTGKDVVNFPHSSGYLSKEELEYTETPARQIAAKLSSGEWKSYDVTKAFCHRSQIAHQLVNCLTEVFYDEALERAKELDEELEKTGKPVGPFHGLPIGIKDNMSIKGHDSTIGFVSLIGDEAKQDCYLVGVMRSLGGVFYCKTNLPTSMMAGESVNHIFGTTVNPSNRLLTPGGSSGGAGALDALGGAPFDVGSDVGGSVRIPCAYCGLYGLRPTAGRFTNGGARTALPGGPIESVFGPLCRDMDTMEFYLESVGKVDASGIDSKVTYQPWTPVTLPKTLNVAMLYDDKGCKPLPPITRGLKIIEDAFKENGNDIVSWDPKLHTDLLMTAMQLFASDGGKHIKDLFAKADEPVLKILKPFVGAKDNGGNAIWELSAERYSLSLAYLKQWMETGKLTKNGEPIDCIIAPAAPYPAVTLLNSKYIAYTTIYNLLDYSVGTYPVARVDKDLDKVDTSFVPRNDTEKAVWDEYDPEIYDGGCIGIQIICRHAQDEKVVAIQKLLDTYLKR